MLADEIGLVRRNAGVTFLPDGASTQDAGGVILANVLDFGDLTPTQLGTGKDTGFAFPDPFDPTLPAFLSGFGVAAISADGTGLDASDFRFLARGLLDQVAAPIPFGGSRSELTGAIPPLERARVETIWRDLQPLQNPKRMAELGVEALETPAETLVARLEGGAILDDTGLIATRGRVPVTESRLNPTDAEAAIALYESLFGPDGERTAEVQAVLQDALDLYRTQTRARRIVGFELRRFVKNRPSTLLEAYSTLDQLDALFRYHRRLGLPEASSGDPARVARGHPARRHHPRRAVRDDSPVTLRPRLGHPRHLRTLALPLLRERTLEGRTRFLVRRAARRGAIAPGYQISTSPTESSCGTISAAGPSTTIAARSRSSRFRVTVCTVSRSTARKRSR